MDIQIQQSPSSLSGFCIIFKLQPMCAELLDEYEMVASSDENSGEQNAGSRRWQTSPWIKKRLIRPFFMGISCWTSHVLGVLVLCAILRGAHVAVHAVRDNLQAANHSAHSAEL